jgi:hypothetical protein
MDRRDADSAGALNKLIRANGELLDGRTNIPEVEAEVDAWYEATSFEAEAAALRRLNKVAIANVVYPPLGSHLRHFAWRKDVTGMGQGAASAVLEHQ